MMGYDEAVKTVIENTRIGESEERSVAACGGQVLAEDAYARLNFPPSPISTRDGYAVRSDDLKGAALHRPVTLRIVETVRAGRMPRKRVEPGTCARIMTGATLPDGADSVVQFEDTDEPKDKNGPNSENPKAVRIHVSAGPGSYINARGSTVERGTLVLPAGTVMGPPQISALITSGCDRVRVIRRPRIAVIATGDELTSPGTPLQPGKIYNSNGASIAAMVAHYGGIPRVLGIARDREASLLAKIRRGLESDAVITTGGVSMGDYDVVRMLLGKKGRIFFTRIKMGPGAGAVFSLMERPVPGREPVTIPVFGLAGPPGGSIINFETLVRPALLKMRGLMVTDRPEVEAVAVDSSPESKPTAFVKWTTLTGTPGAYRVAFSGAGEKGGAFPMATANSLTIIPEGAAIKAGDKVRVLPLDWSAGGFRL